MLREAFFLNFIASLISSVPVAVTPVPSQILFVGEPFDFTLPGVPFQDTDGPVQDVVVTYKPRRIRHYLTFDSQLYRFNGTLASGCQGTYNITLTARGINGTGNLTFRIMVPNREPKIHQSFKEQLGHQPVVYIDELWNFTFSPQTFQDPDFDRLRFRCYHKSPKMQRNNIIFKPKSGQQGKYSISITVEDGHGGMAIDSFGILIPNRSPIFLSTNTSQSFLPNPYRIQIDQDFQIPIHKLFLDPDRDNMTLRILNSIPKLPSEIFLDEEITLKGRANILDLGTYQIELEAQDGHDGISQGFFKLIIEKNNGKKTTTFPRQNSNPQPQRKFHLRTPKFLQTLSLNISQFTFSSFNLKSLNLPLSWLIALYVVGVSLMFFLCVFLSLRLCRKKKSIPLLPDPIPIPSKPQNKSISISSKYPTVASSSTSLPLPTPSVTPARKKNPNHKDEESPFTPLKHSSSFPFTKLLSPFHSPFKSYFVQPLSSTDFASSPSITTATTLTSHTNKVSKKGRRSPGRETPLKNQSSPTSTRKHKR